MAKKLVFAVPRYSLRYTGAIVSDICQQFTKKQGVFANPASPKSPAKLPLAFAALPFAHMVEKAGGKSSDGMTGGCRAVAHYGFL